MLIDQQWCWSWLLPSWWVSGGGSAARSHAPGSAPVSSVVAQSQCSALCAVFSVSLQTSAHLCSVQRGRTTPLCLILSDCYFICLKCWSQFEYINDWIFLICKQTSTYLGLHYFNILTPLVYNILHVLTPLTIIYSAALTCSRNYQN